jgi:hypothetical protein
MKSDRGAKSAAYLWPILLTLASLVGGCGGGSVRTATQKSAATAASIASADSLCRRINTEIDAVQLTDASPKEIARLTPRNIALERQALRDLKRFRFSGALAREWQLVLGYRARLAEELVKLVQEARKDEVSALIAQGRSKKLVHRSLSLAARRAGFKDCGQVG